MNLSDRSSSRSRVLLRIEKYKQILTRVQEALREEIWLSSQRAITEEPEAFITPASEDTAPLTARGQKVKCYECKGYGHVARNCEKKQFCNYCKKTGHLISDYTRRPPKRNEQPLKQGQTASALQDQNLPDSASSSSGIVMLMLAQIWELINNYIPSAFTSMGENGHTTSPAFHYRLPFLHLLLQLCLWT